MTLGLHDSPAWHTDRSALGALAGWCAALTGALGKMAGDLVLMGRSESGEARAGAGGGSSTMPQKSNPVAAETALALARLVACLATPVHLAALHAEERDGAAWSLEWLVLPQIVVATAAALRHAQSLAETLAPDPDRMREVLEAGGGVALAEAASFRLAAHMPRADAQALVKQAVAALPATGETLAEALTRLGPVPVTLAPADALGGVGEAIDALLRDQGVPIERSRVRIVGKQSYGNRLNDSLRGPVNQDERSVDVNTLIHSTACALARLPRPRTARTGNAILCSGIDETGNSSIPTRLMLCHFKLL